MLKIAFMLAEEHCRGSELEIVGLYHATASGSSEMTTVKPVAEKLAQHCPQASVWSLDASGLERRSCEIILDQVIPYHIMSDYTILYHIFSYHMISRIQYISRMIYRETPTVQLYMCVYKAYVEASCPRSSSPSRAWRA